MPTQAWSSGTAPFVAMTVLYIVLAIALGFFARSKGYSMAVGIALSLFTSFLIAWLIIRLLPDKNPVVAAESSPLDDPKFRLRLEYEKAKFDAEQRAAAQAAL